MSATDHVLTREQIREVDRLAIEEYGIPGTLLMENAGRGASELLLSMEPQRVAVFCGPGNNGGDGYVVARHLALAGVDTVVLEFAAPERSRGDAEQMRLIVRRLCERETRHLASHACWSSDVEASLASQLDDCDVCVDALLGTGFAGEVREPIASAIRLLNETRARGARTMALDLPSGLDANTGEPAEPTVIADLTATFAARKVGFEKTPAKTVLGRVEVVSIGVPVELLERAGRLESGQSEES